MNRERFEDKKKDADARLRWFWFPFVGFFAFKWGMKTFSDVANVLLMNFVNLTEQRQEKTCFRWMKKVCFHFLKLILTFPDERERTGSISASSSLISEAHW